MYFKPQFRLFGTHSIREQNDVLWYRRHFTKSIFSRKVVRFDCVGTRKVYQTSLSIFFFFCGKCSISIFKTHVRDYIAIIIFIRSTIFHENVTVWRNNFVFHAIWKKTFLFTKRTTFNEKIDFAKWIRHKKKKCTKWKKILYKRPYSLVRIVFFFFFILKPKGPKNKDVNDIFVPRTWGFVSWRRWETNNCFCYSFS